MTALLCVSVMEMGQWVMGHGSNGSLFLDGSRGSWSLTASDASTHRPWWWNNCAEVCNFKYTTYRLTV